MVRTRRRPVRLSVVQRKRREQKEEENEVKVEEEVVPRRVLRSSKIVDDESISEEVEDEEEEIPISIPASSVSRRSDEERVTPLDRIRPSLARVTSVISLLRIVPRRESRIGTMFQEAIIRDEAGNMGYCVAFGKTVKVFDDLRLYTTYVLRNFKIKFGMLQATLGGPVVSIL